MIHQDISDLDFNTYFSVPHNDQQAQNNSRLLLDNQTTPTQQINVPHFNSTPHSYYNPPYQMLDWQQDPVTTISTPNGAAPTNNNTVPTCNSDYLFPTTRTNSQTNHVLNSLSPRLEHKRPTNINQGTTNHGLPTPVSEVMFPETPHSHTSSSSSSSPSPTMTDTNSPIEPNNLSCVTNWNHQDTDKSPNEVSSFETRNHHQIKKAAHNAIERRYRNNINDRIQELKQVVPALCCTTTTTTTNDNNKSALLVEGIEVAHKLNKATILQKATEYIHHLKHMHTVAERENQVLQQMLVQIPGGTKVLAQFHRQKQEFQQKEHHRLLEERKQGLEQEKLKRQKVLRERAAQRAALAELLPKQTRKPYRRKKQ